MQYDDFVGQVQHRARLASTDEAVRAIRSTLAVFGRRLHGGQAEHLASQLPKEIAEYLPTDSEGDAFSMQEFLEKVAAEEEVDLPVSVHHTRAVLSVLQDAVTEGEMRDVRGQLPQDWQPLFEAGSEGDLEKEG